MALEFYGGGGGSRGELKTGIVFFIPQTCQARMTIGKGGAGGIGHDNDSNTGGFAKSGEPSMFVIDNVISIIAEGGHKGKDAYDIISPSFDVNLTGGAGKCKYGSSINYPPTKGTDGFQPGGNPGTGGGGGAGGYSSGPKAENGQNPSNVDGTGGNGGAGYGAGGGGGGFSKYTYGVGVEPGRGGNGNSGCVVLWKL